MHNIQESLCPIFSNYFSLPIFCTLYPIPSYTSYFHCPRLIYRDMEEPLDGQIPASSHRACFLRLQVLPYLVVSTTCFLSCCRYSWRLLGKSSSQVGRSLLGREPSCFWGLRLRVRRKLLSRSALCLLRVSIVFFCLKRNVIDSYVAFTLKFILPTLCPSGPGLLLSVELLTGGHSRLLSKHIPCPTLQRLQQGIRLPKAMV